MLNYTDLNIRQILLGILGREDFSIIPIGNHHLKRHLVYKVCFPDSDAMIFKLYYKTDRRSREIAGLRLLENSTVKAPRIISYGNLTKGEEWILTECLDGDVFDNVYIDLSEDNKQHLFEEMGEELGKIHSFKTFDYFGNWDENGNPLSDIRNWYDSFVIGMESSITDLESIKLPHKDLIDRAITILRNKYEDLDIDIKPRLTHYDFDGRNILVKPGGDGYTISGVVDFEQCHPGNSERDLVGLYYRYFHNNKLYEEAFLIGYRKYFKYDENFKKRLFVYMLSFIISNATWSYEIAPDYYKDNMKFLKNILEKAV